MALDFLLSNKPQAKFNGLTVINFDASISESHTYDAVVTTNPVETGAKISDNILINPIMLNITGFITDTPFKTVFGLAFGEKEKSGSGSLSKTAHDDLVKLFNSREPFEVVTGLNVYKNMVLKRLSFPRNSRTGQAITFTCQLVQIILVDFETEELKKETISNTLDSKEQGQKKEDVGKANAQVATEAEKGRATLALKLVQALGFLN